MKQIKPFLLIFIFPLLFCAEAVAQDNTYLGFRLSGGQSTFTGRDANPELSRRVAGSIGVYMGLAVSEEWHLRPEFAYAIRGTDSDSLLISLHYAELNLPLHYVFAGEYLRFEAGAGPSLAYLLRADNSRNPITDFYKSYNLAAQVSTGFRWEFASWQYLSGELVYRWGLTSIAADTEFQAKTSFLGLSASYAFVF